jgi:hypothetical protein
MKTAFRSVRTLAATFITFGSLAGGANAAVIISPSSISSSGRAQGVYDIELTINQSGLSTGYVSGVTDFDAYIASNPTHNGQSGEPTFYGTLNEKATIDLSFDEPVLIDRVVLWNYPFLNSAGLSGIEIFVSPDASYTYLRSIGSFSPLDNVSDAQVFNITDTFAKFIRITTETDFSDFNITGFSEIAFSTIPEPSATALIGLAATALAVRRRRRK